MTALRVQKLELHLTDRDIRILEDLEQFRLLTTRQIQRLHLPAKPLGSHVTISAATRGTTRILNRLEDLDAIERLERRIGGLKHGSALTIWHIGGAGERYLRARRGDTARRRYHQPNAPFIAHTLAIAEVATALREQVSVGRFELLELASEPACWRAFTGPGGQVLTLKPDLFAITADARTETHSFIEIDLDTEHPSAVVRKCRLYQQYFRTGIEQQAQGLFPAIVWIVPTMKRARTLQEAIAADRTLDPHLFWVIPSEQALAQLAPYSTDVETGNTTSNPKGGIS